jgi:predicted PurR-regulated permease PerM
VTPFLETLFDAASTIFGLLLLGVVGLFCGLVVLCILGAAKIGSRDSRDEEALDAELVRRAETPGGFY